MLLGHGFGGSKDDVRAQAEQLARDGYAVLTWSARGFGESTGQIGLNDPDDEVKDVSRLIDWLASGPRSSSTRTATRASASPAARTAGRSRCSRPATTSGSTRSRPQITYWNLADALFPNGVFKKLWAGIFFSTGSTAPAGSAAGRARTPGR